MKNVAIARVALGMACTLSAAIAQADLQPISDAELSDVTGQAFISIDRHSHPAAADTTVYTRINLGLDIEIQTHADIFEFGRYERAGEMAGSSDLMIRDFGLGYIYDENYFRSNPSAARQRKADGSDYTNGEIVPFHITDPFIEFAYDEGTNDVVGVRVGFGKTAGILSGNIETLTGSINVDIIDRGEGMRAAQSGGSFGDQLIVLLTPLLEGSSPLYTVAKLVQGDPNKPNYGELDPIRSEFIGVPDGDTFTLEGASAFTRWSLKNLIGWFASSEIIVPDCSFFWCPGGDIIIVNQDCKVLGVTTCFDLGMYNSFPLGNIQRSGSRSYITGPTDGLFLSFQTKDLNWLKDVRKNNPTPADFLKATQGAFFNVPNGTTQVNLEQALGGIDRYRTEYIDRGRGLF